MTKLFTMAFFIGLLLFLCLVYFYVPRVKIQNNITWGVNFSQAQAEFLKLDWKKTYLAILEDLGAHDIKLITNWDWVQGQKGEFYFDDIDWQISQAEKYGARLMYVVGMKTGRWPECHLPTWAEGISKQSQQEEILNYIKKVVLRYKDSSAIVAWQAENEPLFNFGVCPWYDEEFLKKEVELIKSLDPTRPVIVSDSGEQSMWLKAAKMGDIVGTTLYRKVWAHISDDYGFYVNLPLPPKSYWIKSQIVKLFFNKKVINVELQAEPWFPDIFKELPIKEQEEMMNVDQLRSNINYAKQTGFDTFYFWGTEWWYWMKENHQKPELWNEVKKLIQK